MVFHVPLNAQRASVAVSQQALTLYLSVDSLLKRGPQPGLQLLRSDSSLAMCLFARLSTQVLDARKETLGNRTMVWGKPPGRLTYQ